VLNGECLEQEVPACFEGSSNGGEERWFVEVDLGNQVILRLAKIEIIQVGTRGLEADTSR
jgi:hypothetical protein